MNGKSFKSFEAVQASCIVNEDINDYGIESWLKSAKSLYKRAQVAQENNDLIDAYIYYTKTYEICYSGKFAASSAVDCGLMYQAYLLIITITNGRRASNHRTPSRSIECSDL